MLQYFLLPEGTTSRHRWANDQEVGTRVERTSADWIFARLIHGGINELLPYNLAKRRNLRQSNYAAFLLN